MIGYELGSSSSKVCILVDTCLVENFEHGCQHGNIFLLGEFCGGQLSLDVMHSSFAHSFRCIQDISSYQDCCGLVVTLVWACCKVSGS